MAVFSDWERQSVGVATVFGIVAMGAFHNAPSVVPPGDDKVNFLPLVLSHVCEPEHAGHPVERESPGVSDSQSENLRTASSRSIGIAGGNSIGTLSIDVDSKNFPQPLLQILRAVLRVPF